MTTAGAILLVEDNEDDIFLMKRALHGAGISNELRCVEDGQQAIDYLSGEGQFADRDQFPLPAIVFLDLKLPLKSGRDVLAWVRSNREFEHIVVLVLTSSNEPSDLHEAYRLGANSYLVKPATAGKLLELAKAFKGYWLEFNHFEEVSA